MGGVTHVTEFLRIEDIRPKRDGRSLSYKSLISNEKFRQLFQIEIAELKYIKKDAHDFKITNHS